jgi:puromycin-sensitive aminopeptidase
VAIAVLVDEPTDRVALDAAGLEIAEAEVNGVPAAVSLTQDRIVLVLRVPLDPGAATIRIVFRGTLGRAPRGLYLTGGCAVTQLQPAYAHLLFPCFDTPALKATFDLSVTAGHAHSVISNASVVRDENLGDRHRLTFATSPRMPAHLLGIAIGPFASIATDGEATRIRFHATGSVAGGAFALEAARHFLRFYNDWFDVPYGLDKLDLVAVPAFDAGGMENTGAIFFRDTAVSIDPGRVPAAAARHAANLIAHELAHHWFGSLVTPASWDDLWLNEGFATWMAPKAVAGWNAALTHETEELQAVRSAMAADSLASSRPMRKGASSAAAIEELFDPIAYRKGAAILRMLEAWLGVETFRAGVNLYVERHAGRTATSDDLWNALEEASGHEVAEVATHFVSSPGVPQLELAWEGAVVRIAQNGPAPRAIPISIKAGLDDGRVAVHRHLLRTANIELTFPGAVQWAFGNAGAAGYYRCAHADAGAIDLQQLSPVERMALLEDLWDGLWNGTSDTLEYLRLATALLAYDETRRILAAHLGELRELLAPGARRPQFDQWLAKHAAAADGGETTLALLGLAGEARAIEQSRSLVETWLAGGSPVDDALLDAAILVAARHGDRQLFERLLRALEATAPDAMALDITRLLRGLGAFESPDCIEGQLALVHHPRLVAADVLPYVDALLANPAVREATWAFLKANWDALRSKVIAFGGRGAILSLGAFSDAAAKADIASFFVTHDVSGAERALQQTVERIDGRIRFREREQRRFDFWLIRQSAPDAAATEPFRLVHGLLNTLAAGFHGALYTRVLFESLGVEAPEWMHPAEDLRSAVAGLERLLLQLFRGGVRMDAAVLQLAARMNEDLLASARLAATAVARLHEAAGPESALIVSALLAREVATRERALDGMIAFAALFGSEEEANGFRRQLRSSAADAERARRWLRRAGQTGTGRALRLELARDAAGLSGLFQSQAASIAAHLPPRPQ